MSITPTILMTIIIGVMFIAFVGVVVITVMENKKRMEIEA